MQPLPDADVVVCCVVVGGGGAACVVVVGGGGAACVIVVGGGAACVVVVGGGGGVLVWVVEATVAVGLCATGFACACRLALCAGFAACLAVVVVVVLDCVVVDVVGAVAAALWVEVDDDAPHAATINVSRTAAGAMRRCLMVVSLAPWCTGLS